MEGRSSTQDAPSLHDATAAVGARTIGPYRVLSVLGEGGMSTVYAAVSLSVGQPVALKVLRPEMAKSRDAMLRFFREAQAASSVQHPGIVHVLDAGMDEATGVAYIAMERVDGHNLRQLLDEAGGRLEVSAAADLGVQLAETLAAAHALGIVHRDVKPDNVLIVRESDGYRRTKLADFGIAKLRAETWGGAENSTRTGVLLGTPAYMAPEQAQGKAVDHRADIYGLGCVLYECLSGAPPFAGDGLAVIVDRMQREPEPLRVRVPDAPRGLERLLQRMLARDPEQRPRSMIEVRDLLEPLASPGADRRPSRDHVIADLRTRHAAAQRTVVRAPDRDQHDPWAPLSHALPSALRADEPVLRSLLSLLFGGVEARGDRSLALFEPTFDAAPDRRFFATFVSSRAPSEALLGPPLGRIGTQLFFDAVRPLAEEVVRLGAQPGTVVLAIVDGAELGPGIGEVILTCRREHGVAVVPLYIGELRRLSHTGQLRQLFQARVVDLHAHENPFSMTGPSTDPTRCVGMGAQVGVLLSLISEGGRIISVSGPPGCGKSTLVGLAEYACENELGSRVFVHVRCGELPHDPLRLVEHIRALLRRSDPAPPAPTGSIRETVATFVRERRLVLVLEDADWLVRLSRPEHGDADTRAHARELWSALADNVRSHHNTVIVTSVRGLSSMLLRDTFTPPPVRSLLVAPLDLAGTRRVVSELGRSIDFQPDDDALAGLHRASGGNVYVLRAVCAAIVQRARHDEGTSPFLPIAARRRDVDRALGELAGYIRTFHRHVMEVLDEGERRVLHHVARRRPRTSRSIRRALPDVDVTGALKALEDMGYVAQLRGRHQVAVPLLAAWLRRNLDPAPVEGKRAQTRRVTYLALGASLTALLTGVTWTYVSTERVLTRSSDLPCRISIDHPRRAGPGETLRVHVLHDCPAAAAAPPSPNVRLRAVAAAASFPVPERLCLPEQSCSLEITVDEQAPAEYRLGVEVERHRVDFVVARDSLGEARRVLGSGVRIASLLPLLIGSFLAYQRELRSAVRRLLRLGRGDEEPASPRA